MVGGNCVVIGDLERNVLDVLEREGVQLVMEREVYEALGKTESARVVAFSDELGVVQESELEGELKRMGMGVGIGIGIGIGSRRVEVWNPKGETIGHFYERLTRVGKGVVYGILERQTNPADYVGFLERGWQKG